MAQEVACRIVADILAAIAGNDLDNEDMICLRMRVGRGVPAAAVGGRPLRYFIHDDFDAFRIELSGSFAGKAAQKAYEAWRTARSMAQRTRLVVDISFVVEADERGKEILRRWRYQDARIVASSAASRAIADSILITPFPNSVRHSLLDRLASWFIRWTGRNSAFAEGLTTDSAGAPRHER